MRKLVIIGAGQQGKVCKRLAEENGMTVAAFVDDFRTGTYEGFLVYNGIEDLDDYQQYDYIVAFGEIAPRKKYVAKLKELGLHAVNLIDRSAIIEDGAVIGTGNYVGKLAIVFASATIGDNNIINCKAVCATDSIVGNNNNISLGCNICGGVQIGDECYIGCQASIVSGVVIEDGSTIAAGAVVLHDVKSEEFVAGVPAVKKEKKGK